MRTSISATATSISSSTRRRATTARLGSGARVRAASDPQRALPPRRSGLQAGRRRCGRRTLRRVGALLPAVPPSEEASVRDRSSVDDQPKTMKRLLVVSRHLVLCRQRVRAGRRPRCARDARGDGLHGRAADSVRFIGRRGDQRSPALHSERLLGNAARARPGVVDSRVPLRRRSCVRRRIEDALRALDPHAERHVERTASRLLSGR